MTIPDSAAQVTDTNELRPKWICEMERLATYCTQIYLSGNIKDQIFYPLDRENSQWTVGLLRDALFELFRNQMGGYDIVAAYNPLEGMVFADCYDANNMVKLCDEVLQEGAKTIQAPPAGGRIPQALRIDDPFSLALTRIAQCLRNNTRSCVFIMEHAPQYITGPANLPRDERLFLLQLLKIGNESTVVYRGEGADRKAVQNLLILTCENQRDFPAWLYLNNPFCGSIGIVTPRSVERRHFLNWRFSARTPQQQEAAKIDINELTDLTDGMCLRDLWGICMMADNAEHYGIRKTKELVDAYKYGARRSEWDALRWDELENAETRLSERVKGQQAAISTVSDVLRRARLDLSGAQHSSRSKPRGILFFAGPTGVGKTELAKAIAELIFSTEDACVRFDMSEYSQSQSDQRLLGAPPGYIGYEEGGQLTNRVKANPFCVLLFDEIEKAHPSILDKFLQILEDGRMTDGHGDTVYFSESIIIFTSNAGIYQLDPATGRPAINPVDGKPILQVDPATDTEYPVVREKVIEGVQSYFKYVLGRPELLNRIGQNIIVFDFIRAPIMRQILEAKVLKSIRSQLFDRWQVQVDFEPAVVNRLMEWGGNDVASGGRGIGNLAEAALLNPIARILFPLIEKSSLAGKTLVVTDLVHMKDTPDHRYEIKWEIR